MENKYIDIIPDQPIAEGYNSDERELDVPDFPQGEQKVKTVKVEVEDIESGEKVAKKLGEYQGELSPNPGYGEDGETKDATKIHLVEESIPADGGEFVNQKGIKVLIDPYNFIGGLLINGKTIEEYVDSKGGVTEEELNAALLEYTKKSEVAAQLVGKDIQVEGITSKGIANTGNIGNIGDIAATGKITGGEIIENMVGYAFTKASHPEFTYFEIVYAGATKIGNKLTIVVFAIVTPNVDTGSNYIELGTFTIPSEILSKIIPFSLGNIDNIVDAKLISLFNQDLQYNETIKQAICQKTSTNGIKVSSIMGGVSLTRRHIIRYEATFLLSENLASE